MLKHLVAPLVRVTAVMTNTAEKCCVGQVEIPKEAVCCNGIRERGSVQYTVFLYPCIKRVMVGVCRIVTVITLADAHDPLVSHGSNRHKVVFLREIYVRSSDEMGFIGFHRGKLPNGHLLRVCGQTAAKTEFRVVSENEPAGSNALRLRVETLLKALHQSFVIVLHAEVNFVHDRKRRNLIHRSVQPGSAGLDRKAAFRIGSDIKIQITGLPKSQEIHIRAFQPADIVQVFKFLLGKAKPAIRLNLLLNLLHHLIRKMHIRIPALKRPRCLIIAELVIDGLPHRKLVKVGLQKGIHNLLEFHFDILQNRFFLKRYL